MPGDNGFFLTSDPRVSEVAGTKLHEEWWSRSYEYAWALQYAEKGQIVADMGCGWMPRPLKDALAAKCEYVYAVDQDERLLQHFCPANMTFVVGDITQQISWLPQGGLDRIFCVSVLEDLNDFVSPTLKEFAKLLKPEGRIILTFDSPWEESKPCPTYPGLPLKKFFDALGPAGLELSGRLERTPNRKMFVHHEGWNLACCHFVLKKH
jgi:SAM-dependent methyltransferase